MRRILCLDLGVEGHAAELQASDWVSGAGSLRFFGDFAALSQAGRQTGDFDGCGRSFVFLCDLTRSYAGQPQNAGFTKEQFTINISTSLTGRISQTTPRLSR